MVVIDCTETGAPPPTGTEPTMIWRLWRRGASGGGRSGGHTEADRSHVLTHLPKMLIGLTMSATIVSSVKPPKIRITAYVIGMSFK